MLLRPQPPRQGPTPDINVTPLVDVCLVLLIIFMVVMPQLQHGGQVDLPGVSHPDPKHQTTDPVTLTLTAEGRYLLEDQPVHPEQAFQLLAKVHAAQPERRLRLKGDRNLGYGTIRSVFARCQRIGYRGIALLVTSRDEEKGGQS
jgi:biopolymer transport protein ExbD/biopolymer transport protein TolR